MLQEMLSVCLSICLSALPRALAWGGRWGAGRTPEHPQHPKPGCAGMLTMGSRGCQHPWVPLCWRGGVRQGRGRRDRSVPLAKPPAAAGAEPPAGKEMQSAGSAAAPGLRALPKGRGQQEEARHGYGPSAAGSARCQAPGTPELLSPCSEAWEDASTDPIKINVFLLGFLFTVIHQVL